MILIKCICKAIKDYSVLQGSLSHFHPSSHVNHMRCLQEGIVKGVRCFISPVHNTARELKRQTPVMRLQVATPNPSSLRGCPLRLSLRSLPAGVVSLACAFPQQQITRQQVFSLHRSNQSSLGPYGRGFPILPVTSRWFSIALHCQPTPTSFSALAASEPWQKRPLTCKASDHQPSAIPRYNLGLKTLKWKPYASFHKLLGEQQHFHLFLLWASCNTKKLSIASCHKQIIHHNRARWKLKWNFKCHVWCVFAWRLFSS